MRRKRNLGALGIAGIVAGVLATGGLVWFLWGRSKVEPAKPVTSGPKLMMKAKVGTGVPRP